MIASASLVKEGSDKSKCSLGGSHHPPSLFEGHSLVAVTIIDPASSWQLLVWLESQFISKHAPH